MACGRGMFVPGLRSIQFLSQFSSQSTKRERRKVGISPAVGIYTPKCQCVPSTEILTPALLFPVQDGEHILQEHQGVLWEVIISCHI